MSDNATQMLTAVENELRACVPSEPEPLAPLYQMMGYHMGWLDRSFNPDHAYAGKRLRPLLCLLCCQAAGGEWQRALPAAAALELVHNFSLLHDDIEDNSDTRRGRATVWSLWGLAHGVNTGDAMLVLARRALTRLCQHGFGDRVVLEAYDLLDRTLARLCEGQFLDIAHEGDLDTTEEQYNVMISGKTSALLAASAQLGALLGGSPDHDTHYHTFGHKIGLAFQMVDDLLGIWGNPAVTGKSAASDIANRKMTLPVIYGLRVDLGTGALRELYRRPELTRTEIERVTGLLDAAGAREYVAQRASEYMTLALSALERANPQPIPAASLRQLAQSLIRRSL